MQTAQLGTTSPHISDDIRVPRYQQVFSTLHQWIIQGRYATQTRLEPEKELCEIFGVSRITVRKALQLLSNEGLVKSKQGKGTYVVSDSRRAPVRADMNQRIERARELARTSQVIDLTISEERPVADVCNDLGVAADCNVQKVSYIRVLRDMRIGYVESHFPQQLNITFTADDFESNTLLTVLEEKGLALSGIDHLVGATLADTQLAVLLDVSVGAPLVRVKMVMLDLTQQPVQKVVAFFRADQYEHHVFLARNSQEN